MTHDNQTLKCLKRDKGLVFTVLLASYELNTISIILNLFNFDMGFASKPQKIMTFTPAQPCSKALHMAPGWARWWG